MNYDKTFLKEQHPLVWVPFKEEWDKIKEATNDSKKPKSKRKRVEKEEGTPGSKKQLVVSSFLKVKELTKAEQERADGAVVKYIVSEMRPLRTVNSESFREMLLTFNPRAEVMGQEKLRSRISEAFTSFKVNLISKLKNIDHVCITTDAWTANKRSFLGYTAHWIGEDLKRNSVALACKRKKGK